MTLAIKPVRLNGMVTALMVMISSTGVCTCGQQRAERHDAGDGKQQYAEYAGPVCGDKSPQIYGSHRGSNGAHADLGQAVGRRHEKRDQSI